MPLLTLHTLSHNKRFEYKHVDGEEIVIYPTDGDGNSQRRYALVITAFEQQTVRQRIARAGSIAIGASRDNPPDGSLGACLKELGCSPQILSYLSAILVREGFCTAAIHRKSVALTLKRKTP